MRIPGTTEKSKSEIRILSLNTRGIRGKVPEFHHLIDHYNPDVICITETHLDANVPTYEIFPINFNVYRKDRRLYEKGGVAIAIKDTLVNTPCPELDSAGEIVWANVSLLSGESMLIGSFYRPPSSRVAYWDTLADSLQSIPQTKTPHIVLTGDFNAPEIDWIDSNGNHHLENIANELLFTQLVTEPTRITETSATVLDLVFVSIPDKVQKCSVLPGISDHELVLTDIQVRLKHVEKPKRKIYLYNKGDFDSFWIDLAEFKQDFFETDPAVRDHEENWKSLKEALINAKEKHIPSKWSRPKQGLPWVDGKIRKLIRRRDRLHKKAKKSNCPLKWEQFREARKAVKKELKKQHNNYVKNMVDNLKENPQAMWKYIKSKRLENVGIPTLKQSDRSFISDQEKANVLGEQFRSVFTRENLDFIPYSSSSLPTVADIFVSTEGVYKLLKDLPVNKAAGPDDITPRLLKESAEEIAPVLASIFQQSLDEGTLPNDWLVANITPLFKKGNTSVPGNYRPVSLTSISCKLLEHIIHSHISRHLEHYNILTPKQHGFRKQHSCVSQLILAVNDWAKDTCIENNKQIDIAIFDVTKAFDTVPHERLKSKLHHYGIRGRLLHWISTFLCCRKQRVVLNGSHSDWDRVESGVPQGTVLGPLLFLLYINDIGDKISSEIRLFADDCIVFRPINNEVDSIELQKDIKLLSDCSQTWQMSFNPKKCYVMHMGTKRNMYKHAYKMYDHVLETVENHQYLGIYISHNLKGVLHPWALFLKTLCIFSKNKATSDKVSYGSGQKCSKKLKNHSFTSVETIVVKLQ